MSLFKSLLAKLNPNMVEAEKVAKAVQSQLPIDWEERLQTCDFQLARTELQQFFEMGRKDAAAQGQHVYYKEHFVQAWRRFSEEPCFESARAIIKNAPEYGSILWPYFSECCPGGRFAVYKSKSKERK